MMLVLICRSLKECGSCSRSDQDSFVNNYDNGKCWIKVSGSKENYLSEVFHDHFVPFPKAHRPKVIEQVCQLVVDYKVKFQDTLVDDATEAQDGNGSQKLRWGGEEANS